MSLSIIERAGEGAKTLINAVRVMNEIRNVRKPQYDNLLAEIRSHFNDNTLTFATLTDEQVNEFFLQNTGTAEAIGAAVKILVFWETLITSLDDACNQIGLVELL